MNNMNTLDITPTPRILRTLGEIPFQPWQCIAELIDNSIDAFLSQKSVEDGTKDNRININWTADSVGAMDRTIEVSDNACGMSIEQLQNAVRAGYSSNNPINNLGLFGMGFNISTARLGEVTTILTTRRGDLEWIGVTIDFQKLIATGQFDAPIIREPKENLNISGTKIVIKNLKQGILDELPRKEAEIRRHLENIYAPLLISREICIIVRGKQLRPRMHCVWADTRYVSYNNQNVAARIAIDKDLGDALFDLERNCYLPPDEATEYRYKKQRGEVLPENIVIRSKKLTGWLGIQRYADTSDFGIDFIRNGRKILISDKTLFQYENPYTDQKELQYPLELGTTVGGRIIGELNVDYLLPTYQKNDFDRTDKSWSQTVEALCGIGPFLPKKRKALGFDTPNESPLGLLVNAYRRVDKGTKCLFAPNDIAKRYALEFKKGVREYMDDTLWWKAAQEEDQKKNTGGTCATTEVNTGNEASDDVDDYLGIKKSSGSNTNTKTKGYTNPKVDGYSNIASKSVETSTIEEIIQRSTLVTQLSGKNYRFGSAGALNVRAYELNRGEIKYKGERKPCFFHSDGIDCDFIYDPSHPVLAQYPLSPKMLLLVYLSEKLKARDSLSDLVSVYASLVETAMPEAKIDRLSLQDRANSAFDLLREKLYNALKHRATDVVACILESTGEVEETVPAIIQADNSLLEPFQKGEAEGFGAIDYVPPRTLYRIVDHFPEDVFDGKALKTPYMTISLKDPNATGRARDESKERVLSFIKDALRIISGSGQKVQKNELTRASLSVDFLLKELDT